MLFHTHGLLANDSLDWALLNGPMHRRLRPSHEWTPQPGFHVIAILVAGLVVLLLFAILTLLAALLICTSWRRRQRVLAFAEYERLEGRDLPRQLTVQLDNGYGPPAHDLRTYSIQPSPAASTDNLIRPPSENKVKWKYSFFP